MDIELFSEHRKLLLLLRIVRFLTWG